MINILTSVLLSLAISSSAFSQHQVYIAFWNVENLFDTTDDPATDDSEFTPVSEKNWNAEKFKKKILSLSEVIMSMNRGKGPDLLGLCEVENRAVVESLLVYLNPYYNLIHRESPDLRGIDNAFVYRQDIFIPLDITSDTIDLGDDKTRNILGARLLCRDKDTITVFVNHWPSRRGGDTTELKRIKAAAVLKNRMQHVSGYAIALGDFNDEPENVSIDSVLGAGGLDAPKSYRNLAYEKSLSGDGSYKYRDDWNMLDQIIVYENSERISYIEGSFQVFKPSFMITNTGKYAGTPRPTYAGNKYLGGYSDHFPVTAEFMIGK